MNAYVICTSHRSREKVHRLANNRTKEYFHRSMTKNFHLTEIPVEFYTQAIEIKGVRKGALNDEWSECWKF